MRDGAVEPIGVRRMHFLAVELDGPERNVLLGEGEEESGAGFATCAGGAVDGAQLAGGSGECAEDGEDDDGDPHAGWGSHSVARSR